MSVQAYDALAPFYDRFTAHHDYELWLGGLLPLAYAHGLEGRRALDAGCGTGKSFEPLLARGFDVTGFDQSPAMLAHAKRRAGGRAVLHRRDVRRPGALGEFDLITCLDDVLNYLARPGEVQAALAGLAANLAPGGVLLFDANTLATYRGFFAESFVIDEPGLLMAWRGLTDDKLGSGGRATAVLEMFEQARGGWRRTTSRHEQRHHSAPTVLDCARAAGLTCVGLYGQDPAVNLDGELDELRHSKAIYVMRRERR